MFLKSYRAIATFAQRIGPQCKGWFKRVAKSKETHLPNKTGKEFWTRIIKENK